jgi:predicted Zn-dependent peptidase
MLTLQQEKVSSNELQLVKNHLLGQLLKMSDGPYAMMDLFLSVESYQMSTAFYNSYIERIHEIDAETIMQTAQKYLNWNEMSVISAG